jgi:hypothetical protein
MSFFLDTPTLAKTFQQFQTPSQFTDKLHNAQLNSSHYLNHKFALLLLHLMGNSSGKIANASSIKLA